MAKPNKIPTWATDGGAEITEPSAGKRAIGWILERPAYQYFNWLFNMIGQWLGFLDAQFADGGVNRIDSGTNFPAAPNDNDAFLLLTNDHSEIGIFVYRATATTTADGIMVYDGPDGPADPGRWLHVAYTVKGLIDGIAPLDGSGKVPNAHLRLGEANGPASLDAGGKVPNAQTRRGEADGLASLGSDGKVPAGELAGHLVKKWGVVESDAAPANITGSETYTFDVGGTVPTGCLRVVFATPMASDAYAVTVTPEASATLAGVVAKTATYFDIEAWKITPSVVQVNLKVDTLRLAFSIL